MIFKLQVKQTFLFCRGYLKIIQLANEKLQIIQYSSINFNISIVPQNAKLNIITIEGKTIVQILSDHEIKIVGDYDILPLIKRVEEAKDKNLPGPMLNL